MNNNLTIFAFFFKYETYLLRSSKETTLNEVQFTDTLHNLLYFLSRLIQFNFFGN